jgi:hypothetical protein
MRALPARIFGGKKEKLSREEGMTHVIRFQQTYFCCKLPVLGTALLSGFKPPYRISVAARLAWHGNDHRRHQGADLLAGAGLKLSCPVPLKEKWC